MKLGSFKKIFLGFSIILLATSKFYESEAVVKPTYGGHLRLLIWDLFGGNMKNPLGWDRRIREVVFVPMLEKISDTTWGSFLVDSIKFTQNATYWDIFISRDRFFTNNRPVISKELIKGWHYLIKNDSGIVRLLLSKILGLQEFISGQAENISGIEETGDLSLRIKLVFPDSQFWKVLSHPSLPVISVDEDRGVFSGTGPFKFAMQNRLIKNEKSTKAFPFLDSITLVSQDAGGAYQNFKSSKIDYFELKNILDLKKLKEEKEPFFIISEDKFKNYYYLQINSKKPDFKNIMFRKAIINLLPCSATLPAVIADYASPIKCMFANPVAIKVPNIPPLLHREINIIIPSEDTVAVICASGIKQRLSMVKINVDIKCLDNNSYRKAITSFDYDFKIGCYSDISSDTIALRAFFQSEFVKEASEKSGLSVLEMEQHLVSSAYLLPLFTVKRYDVFRKNFEKYGQGLDNIWNFKNRD